MNFKKFSILVERKLRMTISGSVAFKFVSALKLWPGKEEFYFNIQKIPKIYGAINSTKSDRKLSSGVN